MQKTMNQPHFPIYYTLSRLSRCKESTFFTLNRIDDCSHLVSKAKLAKCTFKLGETGMSKNFNHVILIKLCSTLSLLEDYNFLSPPVLKIGLYTTVADSNVIFQYWLGQ